MANELLKWDQNAQTVGAFVGHGDDESLADGIGASYGVINYKGKTWSLKYRGQTHYFTNPDGTPSAYIHVVILRQTPHKSRSFYEKYVEGSDDQPMCSSFDGVVPDPGVKAQQAQFCAQCPRNVRKMNPETGRPGTECREHKRLAVMLLPAETQKMLGEPLLEPVFLRVPAASLQPLALMGTQAEAAGHKYFTYVTRIKFDHTKAYPQMIFEGVSLLGAAQAPKILELRDDPLTMRIVSAPAGGFAGPALAAPNTMAAIGAQTIETGFDVLPAAKPAAPANVPTPQMRQINAPAQQPVQSPAAAAPDLAGFDGLGAAAAPTQPAQPVQAAPQGVVSDQGAPTEADMDWEAKVASLMPSA